jgi:hypothetical protein
MQFHYASIQGAEKVNENQNDFKMVRCLGVPNIISIPDSHIPLCSGKVLFELTHTSWWVNRFMCH